MECPICKTHNYENAVTCHNIDCGYVLKTHTAAEAAAYRRGGMMRAAEICSELWECANEHQQRAGSRYNEGKMIAFTTAEQKIREEAEKL